MVIILFVHGVIGWMSVQNLTNCQINDVLNHMSQADLHGSLPGFKYTKRDLFELHTQTSFCLYHQKDFDRFSDEQKEKLIEHHGKAIKIL